MQFIRQLAATLALTTAFASVTAQTCQPPSISQLFANNITLSSARLNCNTISGASLYQFQYRKVGATGWTATPSSSLTFANITGLSSFTSYEFQCRVYCTNGWTSYSVSKTFTTNSGGNSCSTPIELTCGNSHVGSNNTGNYNYTAYPFPNATGLTGPEAYHRLTITFPVLVTINMTPQTQDLDLYLLSTCSNANGLGYSQNSNTSPEQIAINLNPGTYYVIIDGWDGAISNYTLSISCNQSTNCTAPTYDEIYTTNPTCSSVRLNCDASDANTWDWTYRPLNTVNWIDLPTTSNPFYNLIGLQSSTTYEYRCAKRCSNNVWSNWSPIRQFTTPNCAGNSCSNPIVAYCGYTYTGNNSAGSNNFSTYKYNGQLITGENGPEMIYQINMATAGPLSITLGGLTGDLDLFLLKNCNNNAVVAVSGNSGTLNEAIIIGNLPVGIYQIVVDGWNNTTSNYTLKINGNCINNNSNDEPCYAAQVTPYTYCSLSYATNVGATTTTNPLPPSGCNTLNMRDVWFKAQMPLSGKILVSTFPGTLTDALIAVYAGTYCTGLTNYGGCFDDINGDNMPDIQIQGTPGSTIYLRIWGYNGSSGTFSFCLTTLNSFQTNIPIVIIGNGLTEPGERIAGEHETQEKADPSNESTLRVYPVPTRDVLQLEVMLPEEAEAQVQIFDLAGRLLQEDTPIRAADGKLLQTVDVSVLPPGIYMVKLNSGTRQLVSRFVKS